MALTVANVDIASHPVNAIVVLSNGQRVKFPKVKPAGSPWATDAAWQAAAQVEHVNAINAPMGVKSANATGYLANLA